MKLVMQNFLKPGITVTVEGGEEADRLLVELALKVVDNAHREVMNEAIEVLAKSAASA